MEALSLGTLWQVSIATLMLTLPGSALYLLARQALGRDSPQGLRHAPLFGIGLSIAFWPLLLLYTGLVGLPFSPVLSWAVLLSSAAYVGWRVLALGGPKLPADALPYALALLGLSLLALAFRLGDVAGLDVPMFGDSLHHTMITTMILDNERLPNDWLPYVPVGTFTYHFGFHTLAAVMAQLSGATAPQAVLITGQVLNALAVPAAYLLNRRLFDSRLAGLGAALITGFISIMPAFYVNWGRYTQLSGHVLLVVGLAIVVGIRGLGSEGGREKAEGSPAHVSRITYHVSRFATKDVALAAICVGGLVLVHYRVLIFFGLFLVALAGWHVVSLWGRPRELALTWARLLVATALGLALALPWIIRLLTDYIPNLARRLATVTSEYLAAYNDPGSIRVFAGTALPALAFLGVLAALAGLEGGRRTKDDRRPTTDGDGDEDDLGSESGTETKAPDRPSSFDLRPSSAEGLALTLALWALLLIGSLWIVPGAIGGYTVAITLYIPLAALGGFGIDRALRWTLRRVKLGRSEKWLPALAILVAAPIAAIITGTWHLGDPAGYAYVQQADRQAFAWIRENTPPGSKFLISSEFSYAGRGLTATDAGMWIPLLAGEGRTVSIPASITGNEQPVDPEFFTDTRKLAAWTQPPGKPGEPGDSLQSSLIEKGIIPHPGSITGTETLALARKLGNEYADVGAQGGLSKPRLDVDAMKSDSAHFTLLYSQNGVYLFELTP
jgi:hypothetical protein